MGIGMAMLVLGVVVVVVALLAAPKLPANIWRWQVSEYIFEFGVYDVTEEQAEALFDQFVEAAEAIGAHLGGGYRKHEESETSKEQPRGAEVCAEARR